VRADHGFRPRILRLRDEIQLAAIWACEDGKKDRIDECPQGDSPVQEEDIAGRHPLYGFLHYVIQGDGSLALTRGLMNLSPARWRARPGFTLKLVPARGSLVAHSSFLRGQSSCSHLVGIIGFLQNILEMRQRSVVPVLSLTHSLTWTPGVYGLSPGRGEPRKPRPTAWVKRAHEMASKP
jgi:hypothetical protein